MNEAKADAKEIFLAALDCASPEELASYLDQACAGDAALRMRVEELLRARREAGSFLGGAWSSPTEDLPPSESLGTLIGPYKLLEQIGEGGMGVVYMADQQTPVRRRVALKVIKTGMDTRQVIARFEAERQALAMMDHSNIARVLDAGATDTGRPYFVMELVRGIPITAYCDQNNLPVHERLELFIQVCHAVQHAHQKGIIHRDLKPSNVLVTLNDGQAVPKVIDFGVAKATGQQLTEKTLFTAFAQMVGTPLYMSPEQAEMTSLDIDTRSDIYSLGVLLYELLTGTTPFDQERLRAAAFDEIRRIIREEEPPKPSTRLSDSKDSLPSISALRHTEPVKLTKLVAGDLDWIAMKCLEKDRTRRYETTTGLAQDIERYLTDQPVEAGRPTRIYRLKKFIRRNKVGVLAGSAIAAAMIVGLALATLGFVQARRQEQIATAEAAKATAISELLQSALQSANPGQAKGSDYTVRQLLDDFSGGLANQLISQPEVEAEVRSTIANAYYALGALDLAAGQFEAALALRRRVDGADTTKYAELLIDYAQNFSQQERVTEAERLARQAIQIYRRAAISGRPLVKALWILQLQLAHRLAYVEEQAVVDEALAIAQANGAEYPELANMLHRHAPLMSKQGNQAGAEECARRAVDMHRRLHGNGHPETAYGLADLGRVLRDRKKYRDAESAFREALAIFRRYYRDDTWVIRECRADLNEVVVAQRDAAGLEAQERDPQEALSKVEKAPDTSSANLSLRLAQDALERELRDTLKTLETDIASSPDDKSKCIMQAATYRQVAEIDVKFGKTDEAITYFRNAVAIATRLVGEDPNKSSYAEERARAQLDLAETLARAKRMDESVAAFDAALAMNENAVVKFSQVDWNRSLAVDACVRVTSALPMCARREPEKAQQAHRLFQRMMEQLDRVDLAAANVNNPVETADMYIIAGNNLADDTEWSTEVGELERRLFALLQAVEKKSNDNVVVREQAGEKLRFWAAAWPRSADYGVSAERALQQAIAIFERLTADFPERPLSWFYLADTYRLLGQVLERGGKTEEAEAAYRRAVELFDEHTITAHINDSKRVLSYIELNSFLVHHGRLVGTSAGDLYRRAWEVAPKEPDALDRFAWWLATTPETSQRNPSRAVELAQQAVNAAPHDGRFSNTLGVAQYRAGEWQSAVEALERSMELRDGGDALDWFFLAMAHWQLDQKDEAHKWYEKAAEWMDKNHPKNEELIRFHAEAIELLGIAEPYPPTDPAAQP